MAGVFIPTYVYLCLAKAAREAKAYFSFKHFRTGVFREEKVPPAASALASLINFSKH